MMAIVQDVIFPIMSHTEADQAQWDSDPYEYIRLKFGKFLRIISLPSHCILSIEQ